MTISKILCATTALFAAALITGCGECCALKGLNQQLKPRLGFQLPDQYNSPDGMSLGKDGCIYLSINNVSDQKHPAKILRITPDDRLEEVVTLPAHPETKVALPLGNVFGVDGNLYVSDCQAFATKEPGKSRVLRVTMKDGKATGCDVVALGLNMANGIAAKGDCIYVCDTTLGTGQPMPSGVYRFKLSELNPSNPVKVTGLGDGHLIVKLETKNKDHPVGANGLDFDSAGNMYVCNFGDSEVVKVTFGASGDVASQHVLAKATNMESCDGLHVDAEDNVWVADFLGNAVAKINSRTGQVSIIARNAQSDGADGSLDAPSEAIRRGNKIYVANIDLTYGPNKTAPVHTISIIDLK